MTESELRDTVLALPSQERLKLVEVLWGSLDQDSVPVTGWQTQLRTRESEPMTSSQMLAAYGLR
jgi:hypothetical protein